MNLTEKQYEELVDVIGDELAEIWSNTESDTLHNAEIYQAALDIASFLSGAAVLESVCFNVWRVTHAEIVKEIRDKARANGISLHEQAIEELLTKIANMLRLKCPPKNKV